ncbi:hypothetical protein WA158_001957 [Blastocystis sp. Blastoise]
MSENSLDFTNSRNQTFEQRDQARMIKEINIDFKNSVNTGIKSSQYNISMEPNKSNVHLTPDDFDLLCVLGKGGYGKVVQVRAKATKQIYAMKIINKSGLQRESEKQFMKAERNILSQVNFPFLIKMLCSFQTEQCLYIIMEYCAGGELFHYIEKDTFLDESVVRYYACEMIVAIEHLHSIHILHRDLKPENILLDSKGHVFITDFGLAKVNMKNEGTTNTICGTYIYMAPEMIKGDGYGNSVDWWSLGCLLYQMFTGNPPFYNNNIKKLNVDIMTKQPKYPSYLSSSALSLLKGLLTKDPSKRLGAQQATFTSVGGTFALKNHPFFKGIHWDEVVNKSNPPPFNPSSSSSLPISLSTNHFDSEYTCMSIHSILNEEESEEDSTAKQFNFLVNKKRKNQKKEKKEKKEGAVSPIEEEEMDLHHSIEPSASSLSQHDDDNHGNTTTVAGREQPEDIFKNFSYVSEEFLNTPVVSSDSDTELLLDQMKKERESRRKEKEKEEKKEIAKEMKQKNKKENKKNNYTQEPKNEINKEAKNDTTVNIMNKKVNILNKKTTPIPAITNNNQQNNNNNNAPIIPSIPLTPSVTSINTLANSEKISEQTKYSNQPNKPLTWAQIAKQNCNKSNKTISEQPSISKQATINSSDILFTRTPIEEYKEETSLLTNQIQSSPIPLEDPFISCKEFSKNKYSQTLKHTKNGRELYKKQAH